MTMIGSSASPERILSSVDRRATSSEIELGLELCRTLPVFPDEMALRGRGVPRSGLQRHSDFFRLLRTGEPQRGELIPASLSDVPKGEL